MLRKKTQNPNPFCSSDAPVADKPRDLHLAENTEELHARGVFVTRGSSSPRSDASHPSSAAAPHAGTLCTHLPARGESSPPPPTRRGKRSGPEPRTRSLWRRESRGRRRDLGTVGVRVCRQPPRPARCRRACSPLSKRHCSPCLPRETKGGPRAPPPQSHAELSPPLTLRAVGCAELPPHQRGRNETVPPRRAGKSRREGPARAETSPHSTLSHPSEWAPGRAAAFGKARFVPALR